MRPRHGAAAAGPAVEVAARRASRRPPLPEIPAVSSVGDRSPWVPAYVGLGSNLADPAAQIRRACLALGKLAGTRLECLSQLYRSPPLDGSDQPHYLNAVAGLLTRRPPQDLLADLMAIERQQGRVRTHGRRWEPRSLDLDLLVVGDRRCAEPGLTLPHPGIASRNFVLLPLAEVAPGLWIPGVGAVATLVSRIGTSGIEALGAGPTT
jgi:2-amino-4-hydroxy-6-hydroxymethyldihydropteridine diphosphokinase